MAEYQYLNRLVGDVELAPLERLKKDLKDCDYFISYGEGRSGKVGELVSWQVNSWGKNVYCLGTPASPTREELFSLNEDNKKLIFLPVSGSGTTTSVLEQTGEMRQLSREQNGYLKIVAVTSHSESELCEKADYSVIIPGRTKDAGEKDYYARQVTPDEPTMGDDFEEKTLLHLYSTIRSARTDERIEKIAEGVVDEMKSELTDAVNSNSYDQVKRLLNYSHKWGVFCYGWDISKTAVRMVANRMGHYGIQAYVIGETNTPPMGFGQLGLLFSNSGETRPVIKMMDKMERAKANIVAVIGKQNSPLENRMQDKGLLSEYENIRGAVLRIGDEGKKSPIIHNKMLMPSFYIKAPIIFNHLLRKFGKEKGITEKLARQSHE